MRGPSAEATVDGAAPAEGAGPERARWLVVRGTTTALRVALPALGRLTLGRGDDQDLRLDEAGVAARHAVLHLTPEVELELVAGDAGVLRADPRRRARGEERLRSGETARVGPGDELRLGPLAVTIVLEERQVRPHRAWDRASFEQRLAARRAPGAVLARVRAEGALGGDELERVLAERLEPADLLGELGPSERALLLAGAGEARVRALADALLAELEGRDAVVLLGFTEATGAPARELVERASVRMAKIAPRAAEAVALLGEAPAIKELLLLIEQVADSAAPVLILGETGTGKDLVASLLHARSSRSLRPLVRLGCAELEAGSEGGEAAGLGAMLAGAEGATVLLDEVGALGPRAQVALGQLLEALDVRVLATSNHDLRGEVKRGLFRKDLYFRLNRVSLTIPPLRERPGDVALLADHFARALGAAMPRPKLARLTSAAKAHLAAHRWPGNVRELRNVVERALLLAPGESLEVRHLVLDELGEDEATHEGLDPSSRADSAPSEPPRSVSAPSASPTSLREEMAALERRRILEALEQHPTQADAAKALDVPLRTFLNRLDALGIARPRKG